MGEVRWQVPRTYRQGCARCGCKRDTLVVCSVIRWRGWHAERAGVTHLMTPRRYCVAAAACEARVAKRRDRAQQRGARLVLEEPAAPGAPKGTCRWCGERIVLVGDGAARRGSRRYHRGDEHEAGERDCHHEWLRSYTNDAWRAIELRGDEACADCGSTSWWEADHEVALEDGGEHTLANLVRRCEPCHRAKTAREARARAARRRAATPSAQQALPLGAA